jgi:sulfide dehydrogenase [flavocytochrome c] flavoprotein subunit
MTQLTRRSTLQLLAGAGVSTLAAPHVVNAQAAQPRVVVIGGGWGGATAAKHIRLLNRNIAVTLVEPKAQFITCPYSNLVLGGWREMPSITFTYDALRGRHGVTHVRESATAVDGSAKTVRLSNGQTLNYDRLVVSPGIQINFQAIEGYNQAATTRMPHAWEPGEQTLLLRRQLLAMPDGGVFLMSAPPNPFRCPPGPYERVSMIADYLKTNKPRSKIVILDAKETFSKQGLFTQGWNALYPGLIEWRGRQADGTVSRADPAAMELETELGTKVKGDVINMVPPQRAGQIAIQAGLANQSGWCPINASTMESTLVRDVHVLGDATIAGGLPKSGFAANSMGMLAAKAIVAAFAGQQPPTDPVLVNTCYSHLGKDWAISVAHVVRPAGNLFQEVQGSGGVSVLQDMEARKRESVYADNWYESMTTAIWKT